MNNSAEFTQILKTELVPALGCTEPVAIAYASALARELISGEIKSILVQCSGNILKNVKGVIVPQADGARGVETAAILGAIGGKAQNGLSVLQGINDTERKEAKRLLQEGICSVQLLSTPHKLHIIMQINTSNETSLCEIMGGHTNVVRKERNGKVVFLQEPENIIANECKSDLCICKIVEYAQTVDIADIAETISHQIEYNSAISAEGLAHDYGSCVGKTILEAFGNDITIRAKAAAAAGSDARMSGCTMPVIINSGSGNQGITASVPVIEYARHLGVPREQLIRALALSNLCAIHQKHKIGRLSAYCGAVSAACGAGAGIAFLHGASLKVIENTITNTLANVSGIVCDGAKPSCAAKIASSVDAAILGFAMAQKGRAFCSGEGLVKNNIEKTICGIGRLASEGMQATDLEILNIMLED